MKDDWRYSQHECELRQDTTNWDRTPHWGLSPLVNLWHLIFVISTLNFACKSLLPTSLNWEKMTVIGYSHFSFQEYLKVRQGFVPAVSCSTGRLLSNWANWLAISSRWLYYPLVGCGKSSPWGKVKGALLRKTKYLRALAMLALILTWTLDPYPRSAKWLGSCLDLQLDSSSSSSEMHKLSVYYDMGLSSR